MQPIITTDDERFITRDDPIITPTAGAGAQRIVTADALRFVTRDGRIITSASSA